MPKDQSPKLKGALCNIPVEHVDVNPLLLRTADSNRLVKVKLKKKLEYKGHVLSEPVRTRFTVGLLAFCLAFLRFFSHHILMNILVCLL